jgi:hypothetical protein
MDLLDYLFVKFEEFIVRIFGICHYSSKLRLLINYSWVDALFE